MASQQQFGILDKRFLARSVGLLDPQPPLTLRNDVPIQTAVDTLREHKIGCVILLDEREKVSGIFTERDVVLKLDVCDGSNQTRAISEVMTRDPHCETMTTTIAFALNMMSQGGFRHIPLVDEEHCPVGIISVKDIVDYIAKTLLSDLEAFEA